MRYITLLSMALMVAFQCHAQSNKDSEDFDNFTKEINQDFEDFRKEILVEYLDFVREEWKEFGGKPAIKMPEEKKVPPTVIPKQEKDKGTVKPTTPSPKRIPISEIINPIRITPQPKPVVPLVVQPKEEPKPQVEPQRPDSTSFVFFGTNGAVHTNGVAHSFHLSTVNESTVADALKVLMDEKYDGIVNECLALRKQHALCDWAYLKMLVAMADQVCGKGTNESILLMAYVYMRSGYKMRLACKTDGTRLYFLFASKYYIYGKIYYTLDGDNYYGLEELPIYMKICDVKFKGEQDMSLQISQQQKFRDDISTSRAIYSRRYPGVEATVSVNKDLLSFYETYPASMIDGDFCTKWAMYGNTPMSEGVKKQLYPQIKKFIAGKNQYDALNRILNWVQTGLEYGYDDEIWGWDRTFFAEESLYYPYCDCEDRSVLITRIVRDVLGLQCILVYYPGHLASAVEITDGSARGDYLELNGHKYTIADGTIIGFGADAGITMDDMDNKTAKAILLH